MKKKLVVLTAAAALSAAAVPALAFENEFHGMFTGVGYSSNFFNGYTNGPAYSSIMSSDNHSGFFAEQRARLQYIAKASDDLKLVTHFELDSRFGGIGSAYKGTSSGNDSGQLDADSLTLETKSVYLDFNTLGTNFKVGLQPWADSYKSLFLLADMTGVSVTKKFDALTANAAWFRYADLGAATTSVDQTPGDKTADLFVLDGKFAITKDATVGASYYYVNDYNAYNNNPTSLTTTAKGKNRISTVGLNGSFNVGPATIDPFAAYQFGKVFDKTVDSTDVSGYLLGATAKVKVGAGAFNLAAIYLSGSKESDSKIKNFVTVNRNTTYFNPANMWLLVRNANAINSSTSVLDNDMTVAGAGLVGVFGGYAGAVDKVFYAANAGYAETAERQYAGAEKSIGTELNATVGYKLSDNLKVSLNGAYLFLGKALDGTDAQRVYRYDSSSSTAALKQLGKHDADNPWMANLMVQYVF